MSLPAEQTTPYPDRGRLARDRLRPLSRQALARRRGRGLGDDLPRRARGARRRRPLPRARLVGVAGDADALRGERPLRRLVSRHRARPLGVHGRRRGSTGSSRSATSSAARSRAARPTSTSELQEGAALMKVLELDVKTALASTRDRPPRGDASSSVRSRSTCDREVARFGAWYELFPRSWGGFAGVEKVLAGAGEARVRRRLPAADPPDRPDEPQGAEQRARRPGRRTRAAPGRSATRTAATQRSIPSSGRSRTSTASSRRRGKLGLEIALDFAIQCSPDHPWLKEHPEWFHRRPGRDAQVRGEPAEALPGHLQRQLRQRGLARAVGGAPRRRPLLGLARGARLPRRQPAHEAAARSGSG